MEGFRNLARAAQLLEESLKSAYIGMVPCSEAGQFDTGTNKWQASIKSLLDEVKLLNSKAILINASLQKDSLPDNNFDETTVMERLSKALDSRIRWGSAVQTQGVSRAVKECYAKKQQEEMLIINELCNKLYMLQYNLDKLDDLEARKAEELDGLSLEWRKVSEEYSVNRNVHLLSDQQKKDESVNSELQQTIEKIEVMRLITTKLMVSSAKYDWSQDPAKLLSFLQQSRKGKITLESLF